MKRIEFIGAPYVGKSFLFEKVKAKRNELSRELIFEHDILNSGYQIKLLRLLNKLLQSYFRKTINFYDVKLNSTILKGYSDVLYPFFQQNETLNSSDVEDIFLFYKSYSTILSRIKKYETIGNHFGNSKILIAEESILHWQLVLKKYFYSNFKDYANRDETLKAVIFCYGSEEVLKERFKLRSKVAQVNKNHQAKDMNEVIDDIIKTQDYFLDLTKNLSKTKPVLKINTADDIEVNRIKVIKFLNDNSKTL